MASRKLNAAAILSIADILLIKEMLALVGPARGLKFELRGMKFEVLKANPSPNKG